MWRSLYRKYQAYQQLIDTHATYVWVVLGIYLVGLVVGMLWLNISITPDRLALALFVAAIGLGQAVRFLRDWVPFIGIVFVYESLRGFADNLSHEQINITSLIDADRWLSLGVVPTIWLQEKLFMAGSISWYDWFGTILYFLHFPLPIFLAFYLWRSSLVKYWQFVSSFAVLCLSGFATYILYPAAPPWWAAREGYLPPVTKIMDQVLALFPQQMSISYVYANLNPNPVAAMPSLHAAFPWLVFLTLWQLFGKRALWFLPYCLALWFSIVYLGEHYIVDAIAGIVYASGAFLVGHKVVNWLVLRKPVVVVSDAKPATVSTE
jgi:hypothetical protein